MKRIHKKKELEEAMPSAFRVALRALDAWDCSLDDMAQILALGPAQLQRFQATGLPEESVTDELTIRVSLILGIERALEVLLAEEADIRNWVNHPSNAPVFLGRTPKSVMLDGRLDNLRELRTYLDGWIQGDFG